MNCKLSRTSLIELQLIPKKSFNSSSLCPCCKQPISEHRDEIGKVNRYFCVDINLINYISSWLFKGLGKVPFTRENLFPRLKRIFRKSAVVSMIVGAIVAFVVLALGTLINHIVTTNEKNKQEKSIDVQQYQKKSFNILSHAHIRLPIIDASKQLFSIILIPNGVHHNESKSALLSVISFCLFFSLALISSFLRLFRSRKLNSFQSKKEENNIKQEIPIPVKVYQSVSTQTSC